jgi:uncharacterized membrane protein YgaE (UPF0421/DUF939 family)
MNRTIQTMIKTSLAFVLAIIIATLLQLPGAITSGILAIISIQPTRTDMVTIVGKRLLSATMGFVIAYLLWEVFGYELWVYLVAGVLFIGISYQIKLIVGVVPTLVLLGNLVLVGSFDFQVLLDTSLLLIISAIVGGAVTFLYPSNATQVLQEIATKTDVIIKESLGLLIQALQQPLNQLPFQDQYTSLDDQGKKLIEEAELSNKDLLFQKQNRLYAYLKMRQSQMNRIRRLFRLIQYIHVQTHYAEGIITFLTTLIPAIGTEDQASRLRQELQQLHDSYKEKPLPQTREEFEVRAILFQMLFELDYFLALKIQYHQVT